MGHSRYGNGSVGRRVELSHPEAEERNPHPPQDYYHKHIKLTPEQRARDEQIKAEQREYSRKKIREFAHRLD
jgi:hypothetical protein